MKKAIKINISGVIFHIDEDAYEKLNSYLKSVELYFTGKAGGKEVVDDIESRIAELFQSGVARQKKVITLEDVVEVTAIMGDPSDFVEEAEDESVNGENEKKESGKTSQKGTKRLYRDPDNAVFGGVCGGLGAYFSIDPVILRILFVVLLIAGYGVWGLVYLILWIAIPKAVSIAQKLEMRGERVTISNIEKTVKDEYNEVKANFKKLEKSDGYKQVTSAVDEILRVIGRIIVVIAKILLVLLGIALVFTGFILLMGFMAIFFFKSSIFSFGTFSGNFVPLQHFLSGVVEPANLTIILIALSLTVVIPLIVIIYGGIKLIFRIRSRDRVMGILALILWVASISVLLTFGFLESRKYAFGGNFEENVMIEPPPSKTLYLQLDENTDLPGPEELTWLSLPTRGVYIDHEDATFYAMPSLAIRRTSGQQPELVVEKRARGASRFNAELNAENIVYNWELADSVLIFGNMFTGGPGEPLNFAEVRLRLNLPEDHSVHIGGKMNRIISSARTIERVRITSMTGKKWTMTGEGLSLQP